jgi:transglutaminase-like putative cysteine protease
MLVKTAGPDDGEPGAAEVDGEFLGANTLISTKDSLVIKLAEQATAGIDDPWKKATAIQNWVFQNVKKKNFETVFAPASEVARDKTGDCSEHSVLTAAMCRVVGIPSRIAIGLIYVEPQQGFGFHMWNEVYVNRRWVAIDASFDESQVDAVHIKLSESSLDGVSPLQPFLAVLKVLGKLSIEPIEVQ